MTEVREWWANVYADKHLVGIACVGRFKWPSRELAAGGQGSVGPVCRLHVRIKPDGAPKRYANEENQKAWEESPWLCRYLVHRGHDPEAIA